MEDKSNLNEEVKEENNLGIVVNKDISSISDNDVVSTPPPSKKNGDDPLFLLKRNIDREKLIKELSTNNAKVNGQEISRLINLVRSDYRELIVNYPSFRAESKSSSTTRDIDGLLWKSSFYKQIQEYRKSISKTLSIIEEKNNLSEKAKLHLIKLNSVFIKYLYDAVVFYQDLMLQLESNYKNSKNEDILQSIHHCLLYLGDLSRYQEYYSESREKNYIEAERYYERAAFLCSTSGNPQNQLAVLATYSDTECVAVYHYCRSVLVKIPFETGYDNLKVLFDKNLRTYNQLQSFQYKDSRDEKKNKNMKTKSFCTNFIRLHGILFDWSRTTKKIGSESVINADEIETEFDSDLIESIKNNDNKQDNLQLAPDIDVNEFISHIQLVLDEFDHLITMSAFGDPLLIRLLVICIFSVHNGRNTLLSCISKDSNDAQIYHSKSESLSLILIFGIVNKIAAKIYFTTTNNNDKRGLKPISVNRLLPFLSVFSEWSQCNPQYLLALDMNVESNLTRFQTSVVADSNLLRSESRSRSGMRSSLTSLQEYFDISIRNLSKELKNSIVPQAVNRIQSTDVINSQVKPLREHIELRGFLPLSELYENVHFVGYEPLQKLGPALSDELSKDKRLKILKSFLRDWLIPIAARESSDNEQRKNQVKDPRILQQKSLYGVESDVQNKVRGVAVNGLLQVPSNDRISKESIEEIKRKEKKEEKKKKQKQLKDIEISERMLAYEDNQVKKKSKEGPPAMESNPGQKPMYQMGENTVLNGGDNSAHLSDFPPLPGSLSGNSNKFAGSNIFNSLPPDSIVDPFNDDMKEDDDDDDDASSDNDGNCGNMNVTDNNYDQDDQLLNEITNINYFDVNELNNNNVVSNNIYGDSQSSLLSNNGYYDDNNWLSSRSSNISNSNQIHSFMNNLPVAESTILQPPPGLGPPPGFTNTNTPPGFTYSNTPPGFSNTNTNISTYETNLFQVNNIFNGNNNCVFNNYEVNNDMKIEDIIIDNEDDDDFDDVVVFRPAFSRVNQISPKLDTNNTNPMPFSSFTNSSIFSDLKNISNSNSNNSISSMTDFGLIRNDTWNQSIAMMLGDDEINNINSIEKKNNNNELNMNEFDQEPWWKKP